MYRGVLILGCRNRGVSPHTEVSSFQGVGTTVYRGVLISGGWNHCVQRCPHFRV